MTPFLSVCTFSLRTRIRYRWLNANRHEHVPLCRYDVDALHAAKKLGAGLFNKLKHLATRVRRSRRASSDSLASDGGMGPHDDARSEDSGFVIRKFYNNSLFNRMHQVR